MTLLFSKNEVSVTGYSSKDWIIACCWSLLSFLSLWRYWAVPTTFILLWLHVTSRIGLFSSLSIFIAMYFFLILKTNCHYFLTYGEGVFLLNIFEKLSSYRWFSLKSLWVFLTYVFRGHSHFHIFAALLYYWYIAGSLYKALICVKNTPVLH